jgi:hypothetical protein
MRLCSGVVWFLQFERPGNLSRKRSGLCGGRLTIGKIKYAELFAL